MSQAGRHNSTKVNMSLIPYVANSEECKVWMKGAEKYPNSPDGTPNWKKLWGDQTVSVAGSSLIRHALKMVNGELFDEETGLPHAAHIRCNAAMILEWMQITGLIDTNSTEPKKEEKIEKKLELNASDVGKIVKLKNNSKVKIIGFHHNLLYPILLENDEVYTSSGRYLIGHKSDYDIMELE